MTGAIIKFAGIAILVGAVVYGFMYGAAYLNHFAANWPHG